MHLDIKPMLGVDFQILIEGIMRESGMSDGELAKELKRDKRRIRKFNLGSKVGKRLQKLEAAKIC